MSVLIVGMSHHSAPVTLLEQAVFSETQRGEVARLIAAQPSVSEAMVISTCNRMEVYAVTNAFHAGVTDVVEVLVSVTGIAANLLRQHLYVRYAEAAAEHLFAVTAGMDSLVPGEQQIIGQVRSAYAQAHELGTAGQSLHLLAQSALHAGKRVHSETGIDESGPSMVSVAFAEALRLLDVDTAAAHPLAGKTVMILGAGAMATLAATHVGRLGAKSLIVSNRTKQRADVLAQRSREAGLPTIVLPWDSREEAYNDIDVLVSACGAGMFTVTQQALRNQRSTSTPLVAVDLSMPRDIDETIEQLPGVRVVNIAYLRAVRSDSSRAAERKALAIVGEELGLYASAQRVRDVVPAVSALRRHAAAVVAEELARLDKKSPDLSEAQHVEVERTVRRVVDKLLHQPTVRVKELAAHSGTVSYRSALQELFGLEENDHRTRSGSAVVKIPPEQVLVGGRIARGEQISVAEAVAAAEAVQLTTSVNPGDIGNQHRHTMTAHRIAK
ncbi:glutamyl-tRNA reductase [Corynebacterium choanae]|uniref:Glutamyl-tRNA reductase n=1 Tax=Corynebacterium choanae TaxID=1862358 RepID=A0A3G6J8N9_9CORY|nr:glutamyl-tRNA reductase [Corynebacterium choanae]AZA14481.1 Glutamyl-tRNA reductase [Corynebacterium choanae]